MVFLGRQQIFFVSGVAVVGVFLMQMQAGAQIPDRESGIAPEREVQEEEMAQPIKEQPLRLSGYVDGTYMYNFGPGNATNPLNFPTDTCLLYTSPSPRDRTRSRMPSSA